MRHGAYRRTLYKLFGVLLLVVGLVPALTVSATSVEETLITVLAPYPEPDPDPPTLARRPKRLLQSLRVSRKPPWSTKATTATSTRWLIA